MRAARFVVAAALLLVGVAACGNQAPPLENVTVPSNVTELQMTEPGLSLKEYGYTPVYEERSKTDPSKVLGIVYVACGDTRSHTECAKDLHNRGTAERPNVYVVGGRVMVLEGQHPSSADIRTYFVRVPEEFRDFGELSKADRDALLGVMPDVVKALGVPKYGAGVELVDTHIGMVHAKVANSVEMGDDNW